jgi:hypothetical protein
MQGRTVSEGAAMKRASYREAIEWVALNDSAGVADARQPEIVQDLVSAVLVADIFDVPQSRVGRDIVRCREAIAKQCAKSMKDLQR